MLKKLASVMVVVALICTLTVHVAFARGSSDPEAKAAETTSQPVTPVKSEAPTKENSNDKLRADMLKLVRDAKAGKVMPAAKSQIQPARSNSWSKGTTIAVGVAVAVIAVIVIVAAKNTPGRVL
jgi:hypothetical protein